MARQSRTLLHMGRTAVSDPRIGSVFAGYRIDSLLGRGGTSAVYRAFELALDREVALKLLSLELEDDTQFRRRFLRESKIAASLQHPNVVPVYAAGEADGQLDIAMRLVENRDLRELLRQEGRLSAGRAVALCAQLASALTPPMQAVSSIATSSPPTSCSTVTPRGRSMSTSPISA